MRLEGSLVKVKLKVEPAALEEETGTVRAPWVGSSILCSGPVKSSGS